MNKKFEDLIIGSLILEPDSLMQILHILDSDDCFTDEFNRVAYKNILSYNSLNKRWDMYILSKDIHIAMPTITTGQIALKLSELTQLIASPDNIVEHSYIVKEAWLRSQLKDKLYNLTNTNADVSNDIEDIFNDVESINDFIKSKAIISNNTTAISDCVNESLQMAEMRQQRAINGDVNGSPTGLAELDRLSGGWQNSNLIVLAARPSMGKALPMDANILTPQGWVKNKDLKIGDEVSSIDGSESNVIGIFPQGKRKMYKIHFGDGRSAICDGEHLWEVYSCKFGTKVLTTLQIKDKLTKVRYKDRMSIPLFNGEYGSNDKFLIHPYLLGVLIGDGCLTRGVMWDKPDQFIVDRIIPLVNNGIKSIKTRHIVIGKEYIEEIKRLNLYGKRSYEKHIPKEYINGSRENRLELLRGLIDTDGDVCKLGGVSYNTTSEQLAKDTQYLCWSLGYKCTINKRKSFLHGVQKRDSYRLHISNYNDDIITLLPKKRDRLKVAKHKPQTIKYVEELNCDMECQCIMVTGNRNLYITDDFIVTHNTSLMLSFARIAAENNIPVVLFSLEMSKSAMTNRLLLSLTNIQGDKFRDGTMEAKDWQELEIAAAKLSRLPIHIDDKSNPTMSYIHATCNKLKANDKCGMVLVDYLQLVQGDNSKNREREVANMSRHAKLIAKELNIPFILLSQLSRKCEERQDKRPLLSDLRESGAVEQDADVVAFIYRPAYYGQQVFEYKGSNLDTQGLGVLYIAKQRDGNVGSVLFKHNTEMTKIYDYNSYEYSNDFEYNEAF